MKDYVMITVPINSDGSSFYYRSWSMFVVGFGTILCRDELCIKLPKWQIRQATCQRIKHSLHPWLSHKALKQTSIITNHQSYSITWSRCCEHTHVVTNHRELELDICGTSQIHNNALRYILSIDKPFCLQHHREPGTLLSLQNSFMVV